MPATTPAWRHPTELTAPLLRRAAPTHAAGVGKTSIINTLIEEKFIEKARAALWPADAGPGLS